MPRPLICLSSRPMARHRLVFFPWAGGGVSAFRPWPPRLPQTVESWGVALPGHETRLSEAPVGTMAEAVEPVAEEIARWPLDVVLVGHSVGAWMALETAHLLETAGSRVAGLVVSGMRAPSEEALDRPSLSELPDADFLDEVDRHFGGIGGDRMRAPDLIESILPALRADIAILEGYTHAPERQLVAPVAVLHGRADPVTAADGALHGWSRVSEKEVDFHEFDGGHFFVQEHSDDVVDRLAKVVDPWVAHSETP